MLPSFSRQDFPADYLKNSPQAASASTPPLLKHWERDSGFQLCVAVCVELCEKLAELAHVSFLQGGHIQQGAHGGGWGAKGGPRPTKVPTLTYIPLYPCCQYRPNDATVLRRAHLSV